MEITHIVDGKMTKKEEKTGIVINPMLAVSFLLAVIIMMAQVFIGFGLWTIQDKLSKYDSYEVRISEVERFAAKFEDVPEQLKNLNVKFENFSNDPKNILQAIAKIEQNVNENLKNLNNGIQADRKELSELEKKIIFLENELNFLKRAK
jgi:hypothetical protein